MTRPTSAHTPAPLADTAGHPGPWPEAEGAGTHLDPTEDFPAELAALTLGQLQVLHSRVCLQLEHEYLGSPEGAHPVTLDRHQELVDELRTR